MPEFLATAVGFERAAKVGELIGAFTAIRPVLGPEGTLVSCVSCCE